MKNAITTLLATVIIMSVMSVSFAAAAASTKYATAQQPTSITITDYPKQVKVGQDFDIKGRLTSGNTGLGNKLIYYAQVNTTEISGTGGITLRRVLTGLLLILAITKTRVHISLGTSSGVMTNTPQVKVTRW